MRTLVDCDCVARVHGDGSGVEIDYCPLHDAAPNLLEACQRLLEALKAQTGVSANKMSLSEIVRAIKPAQAAIAKALPELSAHGSHGA